MEELFHERAKKEWEDQLRRSGILDARNFSDYAELRAFSPSPELASRISHYWILRWKLPEDVVLVQREVLGMPAVNLFFTRKATYAWGLSPTVLEYEVRGPEPIAGVTFLPGGFRPYWKKPMHAFPPGSTDLAAILPGATAEFASRLLAREGDREIAEGLDAFFLGQPAEPGLHEGTILSIAKRIGIDRDLLSVADVARAYRIPVRTLQHLFRDEVGLGVRWVILRSRLLEAVADSFGRADPDWAAIAYEHGYSSQAHFITAFKRVFGLAPQRYRDLLNEGG